MTATTPSRIALISGSGSGVGRACALALLKDGWHVVLAGRRLTALEETARLAGDAADRAWPLVTDIADPTSVKALFDAIRTRFGRLDFLFNNAGEHATGVPIDELTYEEWNRVVQTNLTGTFLCAQQAFILMKHQSPRGGRIVNNGALSAQRTRPDTIAFTATKHAISGITDSLSLDGRTWDIACGQIDIGNTVMSLPPPPRAVKQPDGSYRVEPVMEVQHVADTLVLMANMPLGANIQRVTLLPTQVPFLGRG